MRLQPALALLGALASTTTTGAVLAAETSNAAVAVDESIVPGAYIVEFDGDEDSNAFYEGLTADGIEVDHRMDLKYRLFKGASFSLRDVSEPEVKASRINSSPRVKGIWPVRKIQFPKPDATLVGSNATELARRVKRQAEEEGDESPFTPHLMTQVDRLLAEGYSGKGFRIGIVDTGVDYNHPALGGCFGEGCLIEYGYDFNGDNSTSPVPIPDDDPYDGCVGHGTHVAGIIAAQLNEHGFTGAAPGVKLGMYKCTGCGGSTTNEMLIAGFNAAFEDGSDIISCSAGDDSGWAADPWAIAASRIAEAGVPVIVAPGNSGHLGMWYPSTPASGQNVTAVGSVQNTVLPVILKAASFAVDNETERAFGLRFGQPAFQENVTLPLWAVSNDTAADADACGALPEDTPDLSGNVVLLRMPGAADCSPDLQATNLAAKGAGFILWYSNANETLGDLYIVDEKVKGVAMMTSDQGAELISLLNEGSSSVTVAINDYTSAGIYFQNWDNAAGGYMSISTSWGPTWEVDVKPQVSAPGGNIISTYPLPLGGYAVLSGTSMATPLVAAIFALLGEVRGTLDPQVLRSLISATARPQAWYDGTSVFDDVLAPVAQQGGGTIQAYDAAFASTVLSESSLSFNDSDHFVGERTFTVRNLGGEDATYVLGHARAATMYSLGDEGDGVLSVTTFPNPIAEDWAELSFASPDGDGDEIVVVPAGSTAEVTVTLTPPATLNATLLPVYSGYITLNSSRDETLSLPYLGVLGSLHDTPTIQEGYYGGVYLTTNDGHFNIPSVANTTFTIPHPGNSSDGVVIYPKLTASLTLGTPELRAHVIGLTDTGLPTTEWLGHEVLGLLPGYPLTLVDRTGSALIWGGQFEDGTSVPAGSYKFLVSALKVFGDATDEGDWDVVETVPFNIKYL